MKYQNPVISGFFPDPSVCSANGKFYLVTSTFHYFPGVALFESDDLINWTQIGHVLTRESQLPLGKATSSGGIYAPTIRFYNGRFYMVTTNTDMGGNFYVYTDDIYGEWSEPIFVEQDGIDPSLYFEDGKAYFMSNGTDDFGCGGVVQCELDIETGKKLSPSKSIWKGTGGRFLESPHLYKINGYYYLLTAEGGTEYGHMAVYARGKTPFGPFESYSKNPVLTNRNLGGYAIQGCGHGDLISDKNGNWWLLHLAFRQIGQWVMHHITGREVYLVPVTFDEDGWFVAGENGTTREFVETDRISDGVCQSTTVEYTFANTKVGREWCYMRNPIFDNYRFENDCFLMKPCDTTLCSPLGTPSFLAIRQKEMNMQAECVVSLGGCENSEAGVSMYMTPEQHYEIFIRKTDSGTEIAKRICIGDIVQESSVFTLDPNTDDVKLQVSATNYYYNFKAFCKGVEYDLGGAQTKYLSSEIAGNFTGVMLALYAQTTCGTSDSFAKFSDFHCVFSR